MTSIGSVFINAINIKTGGGLQKTQSFLRESASGATNEDPTWFVVKGSALHEECVRSRVRHVAIAPGLMSRLRFEFAAGRLLTKESVCFNVGGPVLLGSLLRGARNVSECAYSNLFYPEIDFWRYESFFRKQQRKLIDLYRKALLSVADFMFVQTTAISDRAVDFGLFDAKHLAVIGASPSNVIDRNQKDLAFFEVLLSTFAGRFTVLFPCGPQRNKRLDLLPAVAARLKELGVSVPLFVLLLPEGDRYLQEILGEAQRLRCEDYFLSLGPRRGAEYSSVLAASDAVANISVLESFSNSFIEAWKFGKFLIVSDSDWARSSAGDSAVFVDPCNADEFAQVLIGCVNSADSWRLEMIERGARQLQLFPSPAEKAGNYIAVLTSFIERRSWASRLRSFARWLVMRKGGK